MKYPRPQIEIDGTKFDLLTVSEYKQKIGNPDLPKPTLRYKMDVSDELDFVMIGTTRLIVYNDRAKNINVLNRRPRI